MTQERTTEEIAKEVINHGYTLIEEDDEPITITERGLEIAIKEALDHERKLLEEAVLEERYACAKVAAGYLVGKTIASAIRQRKESQ